jgi:SAM-dependent methyltransferase
MPKGRDSGMPPADQWESFFNAGVLLDALGCRNLRGDGVEFGCGYGTFTIATAERVSGTLYAMDIDPLMVEATAARLADAGIRNVSLAQRDFVAEGSARPDGSAALVLLFNILHIEEPVGLLQEAHRVLRPGGMAAVIHWKRDVDTPRGPPQDIRPSPDACRAWAAQTGLRWRSSPELPGSPWHWGMVLERS